MKYIFYAILIYLLFRLIFGFIVPVWIAGRTMKRKFREMTDRMEEQLRNQQEFGPKTQSSATKQTVSKDDYIEFEEVK